ncbi:RNA polymerase sigma factor [Fictibacillus iocasae]|uniref:RNA polymerase sigma factor n=1 Tax=Fictibacillus iocasae TaxID=2715437 RepID=A0ABW2NUH1_9BACL
MDDGIIEEWFMNYEKDITSYLVYYTGTSDVEDLVQDTFVIALHKLKSFQHKSHPKTWLLTIARHLVIARHRKKKVWERVKRYLTPDQSTKNELEERSIKNMENLQLYEAIQRLPSRHRDVIILRGILELTPIEASDVLKCSANKVNVQFHRALKKLQLILEMEGYNHEKSANYSG